MLIAALRGKNFHIPAQEIFTSKSSRNMAQCVDSKNSVDKLTGTIFTGDSPERKFNEQSSYAPTIQQPPVLSERGRLLRSLWASVLHGSEHSFLRNNDFFSCGGDDLAVLRLSRMAGEAGIRLSGADIYSHPTLSEMANFIQRAQDERSPCAAQDTSLPSLGNSKDVASISASQTDVEDILPASHMQLTFLIEGQKWCRAYYAWSFIEVEVSAPITRLQESCRAVAQRHPILRTSFHLVGRQCYNGFPDQMCSRLDQDVGHPVCFGEVLTRFRLLIDTASNRQILAVGLSHAQYDVFCLPTTLDDLRLAYTGKLADIPTPPSYHRYIEHTLKLSNEETDTFWRETLKGSTMTCIVPEPAVGSHPIMDQSIIRTIPFKFKHAGTINYAILLQAAWTILLSRLSRTTDITFGHLVSGRYASFPGAEAVIGPCLNIIPVRVHLDNDNDNNDTSEQTFGHLLYRLHTQQIATIPHEATPFDRIAQLAGWPRTRRFTSILQYQHLPAGQDTAATAERESIASSTTEGGSWSIAGNALYGSGHAG
jgi:aryl carrier-like protein